MAAYMRRKEVLFIVLIFVISIALRAYFVVNTEHFSYDAYFHMRFVEHIGEHGLPLREDSLSYGGRIFLVSPLYYYLLAGLSFIFPLELVLKFVPQIFVSLIPILVFLIVRKLTKRADAAIFSSVLSAFVPVLFSKTLFSVSPLTFAVPMMLLALLLFLDVPNRRAVVFFVLAAFVLFLSHPSSVFLIAGLLGYLLISRLEGFALEKAEAELVFFSAFVFLWLHFILYKDAFILHGLNIARQNIPAEVISRYFVDVSLLGALLQLGVFPLVLGVFSVYKYLLKEKNKYFYVYISASMAVGIFIWLRLVQPSVGFVYLGVLLSVLSGQAYVFALDYFRKMRFARKQSAFFVLVVLLVAVTMVVPSLILADNERAETVSEQEYNAAVWLNKNAPVNSTVLSIPKEGHLITAVAKRKNVVDDYFVLVEDADKRMHDVGRMFTTSFPTEAVELFKEYNVDYVLVSGNTRERYGIRSLAYRDLSCLSAVYREKDVVVYKSDCGLKVVEQ